MNICYGKILVVLKACKKGNDRFYLLFINENF